MDTVALHPIRRTPGPSYVLVALSLAQFRMYPEFLNELSLTRYYTAVASPAYRVHAEHIELQFVCLSCDVY